MKRTLFFMVLMLASIGMLFAQIPVFSENWEEGTEGWTFANWTTSNGNGWYRGQAATPAAPGGSEWSVYVNSAGAAGSAYEYTSTPSRSFMYRDIEVPAGGMDLTLKFDIIVQAEGWYDYVRVYYMPTTVTPAASGANINGDVTTDPYYSYIVGWPYYHGNQSTSYTVGQLPNFTEWHTQTIIIPPTFIGQTGRLVFGWNNDSSVQNAPPGSIDNISVYYMDADVPPLPATLVAPANSATNVSARISLVWAAATTGAPATAYTVYLGTANPPTTQVYSGDQTSYTPSPVLADETQYYWQVVPSNDIGNATNCPVWSFTTAPAGLVVVDLMPDGTTSTSSYPVNYFFRNSVSQTIYTETEMGGVASYGQITDLTFRFVRDESGNSLPDQPVQVYLANAPTTFGSFANATGWYPSANFVKVWDGPLTHEGTGLQDFTIEIGAGHGQGTQDFVYEGENLVLMMYKTTDGGPYSASGNVWHYNAGATGVNRTLYRSTDSTPPDFTADAPGSGTTAINFAKIKIFINAMDPPENDLQVTSLSGPGIYNPTIPFVLNIRNGGSAAVAAGAYSIQFYSVEEGGNVALGTPITDTPAMASGASLPLSITDTSSWGFAAVTEPTNYQIYAVLTYALDEIPANNTSNTLALRVYPANMCVIDLMLPGGSTTNSHPVQYYYRNSLTQTIYTEAELGGLSSYGQITDLTFRFFRDETDNDYTDPPNQAVQVFLANAPASMGSFATTTSWLPYANFVKVWDAPLTHTGSGLQDFTITVGAGHGPDTEDFLYEGENIVMMMYKTVPSDEYYASSSNVWHVNTGTTGVNRVLQLQTDSTPGWSPENPSAGTAYITYAKAQIIIDRVTLGSLSGVITDAATTLPIAYAKVYRTDRPDAFVTTNAAGEYSMTNVPFNRSITYYAVGYLTQTIAPADMGWDEETGILVKNVAMAPREDGGYTISGVVSLSDTGLGVDGVDVTLTGYLPTGTVSTVTATVDATLGYYAFPNLYATESYTISATRAGSRPYSATMVIPNQDEHTIIHNITLAEIIKKPNFVTATVDTANPSNVIISWLNPLVGYAVFSYAHPIVTESYGTNGTALDMMPLHRYSHEKLVGFEATGIELQKVSFIPSTSEHTFVVKVWVVADNTLTTPGELIPVASVPVPAASIMPSEINDVYMPAGIVIPETGQLFVGVHMTGPTGYPAAADETSFVDGYSDLYQWNGEWHFGGSEGLHLAWCIYITAMDPDPNAPAPVVYSTRGPETNLVGNSRKLVRNSVISASGMGNSASFSDFFIGRTYTNHTRAYVGDFVIYRMYGNQTVGAAIDVAQPNIADPTQRFMTYTDTGWGSLPTAFYKYAVATKYTGNAYEGGYVISAPSYSNELLKATIGTATVNVAFAGNPVTGAVISMRNPSDVIPDLLHTMTAGDNGAWTFPTVYIGIPYAIRVTLAGAPAYVATHTFQSATNQVYVSLSPAGGNPLFTEAFNSGVLPTGWTNENADGDGFVWGFSMVEFEGPNGGYAAYSASYDNNYGVIEPDNWLISPPITPQAGVVNTFEFWSAAQDPGYPEDRLLIYVGPAGEGTPSWNTFIQNRSASTPDAEALKTGVTLLDDYVTYDDVWTKHLYDISAYAGQSIRIAYRHAFCTDQYVIKIADMFIGTGNAYTAVTISGSVVDEAAAPVANARVSISSSMGLNTMTNAAGQFSLVGVPANATYTVTIEKYGKLAYNEVVTLTEANYSFASPIVMLHDGAAIADDIVASTITAPFYIPNETPITVTLQSKGYNDVLAGGYTVQFYYEGADGPVALGSPITNTPAMIYNQTVLISSTDHATWDFNLGGNSAVVEVRAKVTYAADVDPDNNWSQPVTIFAFPLGRLTVDLMPATGGGTTNASPVQFYYVYSLSQSIYTAAELSGYASYGNITDLMFKFTSAGDIPEGINVQIYLANAPHSLREFTEATDWYPATNFTRVYNAPIQGVGSPAGTKELVVQLGQGVDDYEPFLYEGGNLIVMMTKAATAYYSSANVWHHNIATSNKSLYSYNDSSAINPANPPSGTMLAATPKIIFVVDGQEAPPINDITVAASGPGAIPATTPFVATVFNSGSLPIAANSYSLQFYLTIDGGTATALGSPITNTPALAVGGFVDITAADQANWQYTIQGVMQHATIHAVVTYAGDEIPENNQSNAISIYAFQPNKTAISLMHPGGTTANHPPVNYYYLNSISQVIYSAAELGGVENFGMLSDLLLRITAFGNVPADVSVDIYLANGPASLTGFAGATGWYPADDFVHVYSAPIPGVEVAGIKDVHIALGTGVSNYSPFIYNGGSIIVMMHKEYGPNYYSSNSWHLNAGVAGINKSLYTQSDTTPYDITNPPSGTTSTNYPKIIFVLERLDLGTISGVVTSSSTGSPVANATIAVEGIPSMSTTSNASGAYTLENVPITFPITSTAFTYEITTIPAANINWSADEPYTATLNIALVPRPIVSISGQVRISDSGEGEDGITINVTGYDDRTTTTATIDGLQGKFVFTGIYGNATYTLSLSHPGYSSYTTTVQVGATNLEIPAITITERIYMPSNVIAEIVGANVRVSWINPLMGYSNFSHAGATMDGNIGTNGPNTFTVAHRYTREQLGSFGAAGLNLYKVGFMPGYSGATYTVRVWTTNDNNMENPGNLSPVIEAPYTGTITAGVLHEVTLPTAIEIPSNGQLFVGIHMVTPADRPGGINYDTTTEGYGNLMFFGGNWTTLTQVSDPPIEGNWCIYNSASVSGTGRAQLSSTINFGSADASLATRQGDAPLTASGLSQSMPVVGWVPGFAPTELTRSFTGEFIVGRMRSNETEGDEYEIALPDVTAREMMWIDSDWSAQSNGSYKYTVRTKYVGSNYPNGYMLSNQATSNTLLKAAVGSLTVNVSMQGNSVAGAVITLTNPEPVVPNLSYILTAGNNGSHTFPNIYRGVPYEVTIRKSGGTTYQNTHTFSNATNTLNVSLLILESIIDETFGGNNIPTGWVNVDADNDNRMWVFGYRTGPDGISYSAMSASYDNNYGELTPDNWLISPSVELPADAGVDFSFMIGAQDQLWPEERVLIYIAPAGGGTAGWQTFLVNRSTSNPNSEALQPGAELIDDHTVTDYSSDNGFYSLNYDISQFAGQTVRIAFRHAFCTDWFEVKIANVLIISSGSYTPINISGSVVTENGSPVPQAMVSVSSAPPVFAATNANGEFTLLNVPGFATYTISVTKNGFEASNSTQVAVEGDNYTITQPIVLYVVGEADITKPYVTTLKGNYPNPFNPTTTIAFDTHKDGRVAIEIYNIKGQKVKSLVNEVRAAGSHKIVWNGQDDFGREVGSGIYFYRMQTEGYAATKKMLLMK